MARHGVPWLSRQHDVPIGDDDERPFGSMQQLVMMVWSCSGVWFDPQCNRTLRVSSH